MSRRLPINFVIGAVLVSLVGGAAALSLVWTPHDPILMNIGEKFAPASSEHWLGTDQLGRDVVSQLMAAARNSMAVALIAVLLGGSVGVFLGLLASAIGGWIEDGVMRHDAGRWPCSKRSAFPIPPPACASFPMNSAAASASVS